MACLVGIDEVGFGPLLGPLVVSACGFSIPEDKIQQDLWKLLHKSTKAQKAHLAGRLLITDSKKAYNKALGLKHLQRTVLACCSYFGKTPSTVTELIEFLCPESIARLKEYPWHQDIHNHKITFDISDINIAANVFRDDLESKGMKLNFIKSCCIDVSFFNQMIEEIKNKSTVLITTTSQLIKYAYDSCDDPNMQILIDRQGGRAYYRKNLQLIFPDADLKILKETEIVSSYELKQDNRMVKIHFVVGADKKFLPVSLASMTGKYLRELLIENMNCYFSRTCTGLKPTAGYWKDGQRFIADLKKNFPDFKYDVNQLVRCR